MLASQASVTELKFASADSVAAIAAQQMQTNAIMCAILFFILLSINRLQALACLSCPKRPRWVVKSARHQLKVKATTRTLLPLP